VPGAPTSVVNESLGTGMVPREILGRGIANHPIETLVPKSIFHRVKSTTVVAKDACASQASPFR
jgi:hypothetical protein